MKELMLIFIVLTITTFSQDYILVDGAKLDIEQVKWLNYYLLISEKDTNYNKGALWFPNPLPNFHNNFMIDIIANFGGEDPLGADGIALVFHRDPHNIENVIGGPGLGIGYGDNPGYSGLIQNSFAIEFDTYFNQIGAYDISEDHSDLRFGGNMIDSSANIKILNSRNTTPDSGNIEDLWNQYINVYWFPDGATGRGHLKVYFNCEKIYDFPYFNIRDEMQSYMLNWDNGEIYYGVTAATGAYKNPHRVKLTQELELSQEPLCGNVQLHADFPSFCGNVTYDWQPAEYLDNPKSANPIARRSGVYTCTIGFIDDSAEVIQDYLFMYPGPIKDSITVTIGDKPEYSFSRVYGNSYLIDGTRYETQDGICGTNLGLDCGYIISSWSEYRSDLSINEASNIGVLLLKTDDFGRVQWSRNYINQGNYDLLNLTSKEKEDITFITATHQVISDFVLRSNLKDDEEKGKSDDGSEVLIRSGYFVSGETTVGDSKTEAIFAKFDLDGNLITSLSLKSGAHHLVCYEIKNLADYSYLAVVNRDMSYNLANTILLSNLNYVQEKLDTTKNILFNLSPGNSIYGNHYSLANVLKTSSNVKIKDYEYEHILAFRYMDSLSTNRIGILILNDINKSGDSNIIKNQFSIKDYSGVRKQDNTKIIYDPSFGNKIYILNSMQLSEIDFNGNEIKTITFNPYLKHVGDAKYDKERNLIIFNSMNIGTESEYILYEFNLLTDQLKAKTFYDKYALADNINLIKDGCVVSARCITDSPKPDIFFSHQKNEYDNCSIDSSISTSIKPPTIRSEHIVTASVPNGIIAYEPNIIELDHQVIDKGFLCVDVPESYCEDCDNIDEKTFELELLKVEDEGSQCCYELYIKNNSPCSFTDFSFEVKYLIDSVNQIYYTELIPLTGNLQSNGRYKLKKICKLTGNLPDEIEVKIKHDGTYCQINGENLKWNIDIECGENCCDALEVLSLENNSEIFCENTLTYNLSDDCGSSMKIQIWNSENEVLYSTETSVATGYNKTINVDFDSSTLGNNEEVKVVLVNGLGEIVCVKNHISVDLMKCNCCDFEIEPELYETYNYIRTVFDDTEFGLYCDIAYIDVKYICDSLKISGSIADTNNPINQFDDVWQVNTPCYIGGVPCLNPAIEVTIYYNDSTICKKTQSIPCISTKKVFDEEEYSLLNLNLYPNPTKKGSKLEFELTDDKELNIELFDISGKKIRSVFHGSASKGKKVYEINTSFLSKGVYILLIEIDDNMVQQIMIVD